MMKNHEKYQTAEKIITPNPLILRSARPIILGNQMDLYDHTVYYKCY